MTHRLRRSRAASRFVCSSAVRLHKPVSGSRRALSNALLRSCSSRNVMSWEAETTMLLASIKSMSSSIIMCGVKSWRCKGRRSRRVTSSSVRPRSSKAPPIRGIDCPCNVIVSTPTNWQLSDLTGALLSTLTDKFMPCLLRRSDDVQSSRSRPR